MNYKIFLFILAGFFIFKALLIIKSNTGDKVVFLNVGEGDSTLIRSGGKIILIDGGPDMEVDRYISREFVFNKCVIDILIITHFHLDHIKGLPRLVDHCEIKKMFYSGSPSVSQEAKDLMQKTAGIERRRLTAGDEVKIGKIKFLVVWPQRTNADDNSDLSPEGLSSLNASTASGAENEDVLVFLLRDRNFEILFTSDIESKYLNALDTGTLKKNISGGLDVYKVAHHGSKNSHSLGFISQLNPKTCVISVGKNNLYKHPSDLVLAELQTAGCNVLRTDVSGSIELYIN